MAAGTRQRYRHLLRDAGLRGATGADPLSGRDQACYAFQVGEYAKHFTCISVDLRGAGQSDKPKGKYTTELFADDVAAFMQAIALERAHVSGLSIGAATGICLAAKHPQRVKSLSLQRAWPKTYPFLLDRRTHLRDTYR